MNAGSPLTRCYAAWVRALDTGSQCSYCCCAC